VREGCAEGGVSILCCSVVPEGERGTGDGTGRSEVAQSSRSQPEASASAPAIKMPTMWSVGQASAAAAGTGSEWGAKQPHSAVLGCCCL